MSVNNTATQSNTATANQALVTNQDIERSRTFKIVPKKSFTIPPAGTFAATLTGLAFIGTYKRVFNKQGKQEVKTYEYLGFEYSFVDLNTGEQSIAYDEVILSYIEGGKLSQRILALNPNFKVDDELKTLLGKSCLITVIHRMSADNSKTYANISAVEVLPAGVQPPKTDSGSYVYFDIQTDMAKIDNLNSKHKWHIENKSIEHGVNPEPTQAQPLQPQQPPQGQIPQYQQQPQGQIPQYQQQPSQGQVPQYQQQPQQGQAPQYEQAPAGY